MSVAEIVSETLRVARRRVARLPGVLPTYQALRKLRFEVALRATHPALSRPVPALRGPRLTVIVLSYGRPRNIQPIVDRVLRCEFVDRVVVSNNNPDVQLRDFLRFDSARLELVNQPSASRPIKRFELAREMPGDYFMALDDDVFLRPNQIDRLFRGLLAQPEVPRGVIGQVIGQDTVQASNDAPLPHRLPYYLVDRRTTSIDVLNRVYLFTAAHRDRFFELLEALYTIDPSRRPLAFGDDIVLSFSGAERPAIADVGPVLYCPSGDDPAVARWLETGFHEYRSSLYRDLLAITGSRR